MSRYAEEILKTVLDSKEHPTAEQVFMQMKRSYPKIAQATVYNNLNALTAQGKLIRLSEAGAADKFDNTTRHDQIVCSVCGEFADFSLGDLTALIEDTLGQSIVSYDLRVRYVCPQCRHKQCAR